MFNAHSNCSRKLLDTEVIAIKVDELTPSLTPAKRLDRFQSLTEEENLEFIELFEAFGEEPVYLEYIKMWRTINALSLAVRRYQVIGGTLKIKQPKKVALDNPGFNERASLTNLEVYIAI